MILPASRWSRATSVAAIAAVALAPAAWVTPAAAAVFPGGSTLDSLLLAVDDANVFAGPDVVSLITESTIDGGGDELVVIDDLTIDLNGSTVQNLRVRVLGAALTIRNGTWSALPSATAAAVAPGFGVRGDASLTLEGMFVTATGSECDAAIGGWYTEPGGPTQCDGGASVPSGAITITNSLVIATGGLFSAAIGGGSRGEQGPITITDSSVSATGGEFGPGIGAGKDRVAGLITITDSSVGATGGAQGAGIGGGDRGSGGTVTITGGVVNATGTGNAAGIGGGFNSPGGTTTITGDATVTAQAGSLAAGIGGGIGGAGGSTTISGTATVVANGRDGAPGIGSAFSDAREHVTSIPSGSPSITSNGINGAISIGAEAAVTLNGTSTAFLDGEVVNAGTVTLESPTVVSLSSTTTLTNAGDIVGSGRLEGSGSLVNNGTICAAVTDIALSPVVPATGLTVTGTRFYLPYRDPSGPLIGNAVYAPTLTDGCRALYDASTDEQVHVGWRAGVDGPFITNDSALADVEGIVAGVQTILEPEMVDAVLTIDPAVTSSTAGDVVTVTVSGPRPLSNELSSDLTAEATLSGPDIVPGSEAGTFVSTTAGTVEVTATVEQNTISRDRTLEGSVMHTTVAAPLTSLEITPSATTARQGSSVTLEVGGLDEFGNPIVVDPADVTVTSSVETDVIAGLTVTFPTASPHVLTVTVGDVSAQITIEVQPAAVIPSTPQPSDPDLADDDADPSQLADTGVDVPTDLGGAALLAIVMGLGLMLSARLSRRRTTS